MHASRIQIRAVILPRYFIQASKQRRNDHAHSYIIQISPTIIFILYVRIHPALNIPDETIKDTLYA